MGCNPSKADIIISSTSTGETVSTSRDVKSDNLETTLQTSRETHNSDSQNEKLNDKKFEEKTGEHNAVRESNNKSYATVKYNSEQRDKMEDTSMEKENTYSGTQNKNVGARKQDQVITQNVSKESEKIATKENVDKGTKIKENKEEERELTTEEKEQLKKESLESLRNHMRTLRAMEEYKDDDGSFNKSFSRACLQIFKLHFAMKKASKGEQEQYKKEHALLITADDGVKNMLDIIIYCLGFGIFKEESNVLQENWVPMYFLTMVMVNFSDGNPELTYLLVDHASFLDVLSQFILEKRQPYLDEQLMEQDMKIMSSFMSIVHNIAQSERHTDVLRSKGMVDLCLPLLNAKNEKMCLTALATLADIVDESEAQKIEGNPEIFKFLLVCLSKAMETTGCRHIGWSTRELARTIRRLARNDSNKKSLVKHGCLPLLVKLAGREDINEQREAIAALWTLSFDEDNQDVMIGGSDGVIDVFTSYRFSPEKDLRKSCNGALWNLREKLALSDKYKKLGQEFTRSNDKETEDLKKSKKKKKFSTDSGNQKGHVMISYQWQHQNVVKEICKAIRENNVKVWMDIDDMEGSTLNSMARAVEEAEIVLLCYSQSYKDSDNCRAEAEYAFQIKKKIIPIKMERLYKPDGWLGFIIGSKLFYDFSGKYSFESRMDGLVKEIFKFMNKMIPSEVIVPCSVQLTSSPVPQSLTAPQALPTPATTHTSFKAPIKADTAVKNWTNDDVMKWLNKHQLSTKKFQNITGIEIAFLQVLRYESPDNFYRTLHDMMKITDVLTTAKFTFGLEDTSI